MLTEPLTLKYCECPEPTHTDQAFCPNCGTQYRSTQETPHEILQPGQLFGPYQVLERQPLWAVLSDLEGTKYRFWPLSSVPQKPDANPTEERADPLLPEAVRDPVQESGTDTPHMETAPETDRESLSASPVPDTDPSVHQMDAVPAATEPLEETASTESPVTSTDEQTTPQEADVVVEPADPPAEEPVQQVTPQGVVGEAESVTDSAVKPLLRHHTFFPFLDVEYGGLRGRLEPLQPPKFTGERVRSIRELLQDEPALLVKDPDRVLGWLVQCAQAMKVAHEQGVLVNSFTLDTVFVDVKFNAQPERIAISTALYTAPVAEAVRVAGYAPLGEEPLTLAVDIYQVGALLYELLRIRNPDQTDAYDDPDGQDFFRRPMALVRLALKLMHYNPDLRPQDAQSLKQALMETRQTYQSQHVLNVAGMTDVGLNRDHNEDAFAVAQFEEQAGLGVLSTTILLVCDGVGGSNAGEEASRLAIREVMASLCTLGAIPATLPERLEAAVLRANAAVLALSQQFRGAGCTLVLVYIQGQRYWVAHAGDSRAYKYVNGHLTQLTEDHSWTAQQIRKGLMTPEEAKTHEQAHMIYRSLGERDRLEVEIQGDADGLPLEQGTTFLLCTDGLTDVVDAAHLELILAHQGAPRALARECLVQANASGGPDNITALIAVQEEPL